MKEDILNKYNRIKYIKLIAAILIDVLGVITYLLPALGENADLAWAPLSGILILALFPNRKLNAFGGFVEELIPFTDIIPTATLTWISLYVKDDERTLLDFTRKQVGEEKLVEQVIDNSGYTINYNQASKQRLNNISI